MGRSASKAANPHDRMVTEAYFKKLSLFVQNVSLPEPAAEVRKASILDEINDARNEQLQEEGLQLIEKLKTAPEMTKFFETDLPFVKHLTLLNGSKQEDSTLVIKTLSFETFRCGPEVMLFFTMNRVDPDGIVDHYEILDRAESENEIKILYRMTTKKVTVIQPRDNFVYRCVRRKPDGRIFDFQKSVHMMDFATHQQVAHHYKDNKNVIADLQTLAVYEPEGAGVKRTMLSVTNSKATIGLIILRPMMLSGVKARVNGLEVAVKKYFESDAWRNTEKVAWFDKNPEQLAPKIRQFLGNNS